MIQQLSGDLPKRKGISTMPYSVQNIRNICLLGHSGNGKTSLVESFQYMTGKSVRLGSPADGNTVSDFDPEEIKRQISIYTAIAPVEYNGCKINVLDAPGNFDFSGEVLEALRVSDLAVIVSDAKGWRRVGWHRACVELSGSTKDPPHDLHLQN